MAGKGDTFENDILKLIFQFKENAYNDINEELI